MGHWTKTSEQTLPLDFKPLYSKTNSAVIVIHTYRVGESILKKYSEIQGDLTQDKDIPVIFVYYNCEIKDGDKIDVMNVNVDYDINYLEKDKIYSFTIQNGGKIGVILREKVIDNYVYSE